MNCSVAVKILGIVFFAFITLSGCTRNVTPEKPETAAGITNGVWQLTAFQRPGGVEEAIAPAPPYTIQFGTDGRFAGQAFCNRHMGKYELPTAKNITLTAGASTLMMCLGDSIASEFLTTLGQVTNYETHEGKLILSSGNGAKMTFTRQ
jgi:heat shock protein HslJ